MAEELFALLTEAKTVYLQEVKIHGKQYRRYVEDFVNSHRYIDCDNAVCRNCHEMNIHIVKGLLTDCPYLIQPLFSAPSLSFEECIELKHWHLPIVIRQSFHFFLLTAVFRANNWPVSFLAPTLIICSALP